MSKIVDATQKHIDDGVPGSPCSCALALAIKDAYNTSDVSVNGSIIMVGGKSVAAQPPLKKFIGAFDTDRSSVKPVKFVLDI